MELISGKEALIAIANGEEVELRGGAHYDWKSASQCVVEHFLQESFEFRLKPHTITINGIEVPAPFKPEKGDFVWSIQSSGKDGYFSFHHSDDYYYTIGAWRTEEEIKQVVDALRKVFKEPQQ